MSRLRKRGVSSRSATARTASMASRGESCRTVVRSIWGRAASRVSSKPDDRNVLGHAHAPPRQAKQHAAGAAVVAGDDGGGHRIGLVELLHGVDA
jgi:hypothetical protein